VTSAYGAAGSLIVILLWVYYSVQVCLIGAEFTWVYAHRYSSGILPKHAVSVLPDTPSATEPLYRTKDASKESS
jgi:membrane protein